MQLCTPSAVVRRRMYTRLPLRNIRNPGGYRASDADRGKGTTSRQHERSNEHRRCARGRGTGTREPEGAALRDRERYSYRRESERVRLRGSPTVRYFLLSLIRFLPRTITYDTREHAREVSLCSFSDTLHRYGSHTGLPGETVCRVVTLDTLEGRTGQGLTLEHPQSL